MPIDAVNNCVFSSPSNESNTPGTAYGPTHLACSISWARRHSSKILFSLLKNVRSRHLWREPFFLMKHYRSEPRQKNDPRDCFFSYLFSEFLGTGINHYACLRLRVGITIPTEDSIYVRCTFGEILLIIACGTTPATSAICSSVALVFVLVEINSTPHPTP